MLAARNGNPDLIALLAAAGANVNAKEATRGTTALMWAAEQKHPLAVKALLDRGADVAATSGPAGLPRNYIANYVNTRAVDAAAQRRLAAAAAGRSYDEQLALERQQGAVTRRIGFRIGVRTATVRRPPHRLPRPPRRRPLTTTTSSSRAWWGAAAAA